MEFKSKKGETMRTVLRGFFLFVFNLIDHYDTSKTHNTIENGNPKNLNNIERSIPLPETIAY